MARLGRAYPVRRVFRPPPLPQSAALPAPGTAYVATTESTSSSSFTTLTTTTDNVTVTIGSSGMALVSISVLASASNQFYSCYAGYALSGSNTRAADSSHAAVNSSSNNSYSNEFGASFLETGLTPGSTNFAMQYQCNGVTASFSDRRIAVIPL